MFGRKKPPRQTREERLAETLAEFTPLVPIQFADGTEFPVTAHLIALDQISLDGYAYGRGPDRNAIVMYCMWLNKTIAALPNTQPSKELFIAHVDALAYLGRLGLSDASRALQDVFEDLGRFWRETGALDKVKFD